MPGGTDGETGMAADLNAEAAERLIGGTFDIDFSRVLEGAGRRAHRWGGVGPWGVGGGGWGTGAVALSSGLIIKPSP